MAVTMRAWQRQWAPKRATVGEHLRHDRSQFKASMEILKQNVSCRFV
jgi:hypothetical protein